MRTRVHTYDFHAWLGPAVARREWMGWLGATVTVAAALAATTAIAMTLERNEGLKDASEQVVLLDMEAPAPSALAVSESAPDIPDLEAPEAPDLVEETTEPPPEPIAEDTPIPEPEEIAELPEPTVDEVALPDAPPPPPPTVTPRQRPERPVERQERPREPVRQAAAPAPSQQRQAAAPSQSQGQAQNAAAAGQIENLRQQWGGSIRARISRNMSTGRDKGEVRLRIVVSRDGALVSAQIARSSGNASLDQDALRAAQRNRRLPAAPPALTDPTYSFTLPLVYE